MGSMTVSQVLRPRGNGTYVGRVVCDCAKHGRHDFTLSGNDVGAWQLAEDAAATLRSYGHGPARCTTWFVREPYRPPRLDDIRGDQMEGDQLLS